MWHLCRPDANTWRDAWLSKPLTEPHSRTRGQLSMVANASCTTRPNWGDWAFPKRFEKTRTCLQPLQEPVLHPPTQHYGSKAVCNTEREEQTYDANSGPVELEFERWEMCAMSKTKTNAAETSIRKQRQVLLIVRCDRRGIDPRWDFLTVGNSVTAGTWALSGCDRLE